MKIKNIELKNNICVAPMAGITDLPYRLILKEMGAALMTTELVSAKGIEYKNKGNEKILATSDKERPIALQLFGSDPFSLCRSAEEVYKDYNIIDINMGCPVLKVVRQGEGAALMKDIKKASSIVSTLVRVLGDKIPITIKMRIGYDNNNINAVDFAKAMEQAGASCITVHGRTKTQMYNGEANLDVIRDVKRSVSIPVIGNGGIFTVEDCKRMFDYTGVDGIALARGIKGNPWLVKECIAYMNDGTLLDRPTLDDVKNMMKKLIDLEIDFRGESRAIVELRHHLAWFVNGLNNATIFRKNLNNCNTKNDILYILDKV